VALSTGPYPLLTSVIYGTVFTSDLCHIIPWVLTSLGASVSIHILLLPSFLFYMSQVTKLLQLPLSCDNISLSISCQKFLLFLVSSGAWANHLILNFHMCLIPLISNCNAPFSNLVVFTLFTWPNYNSCFLSYYVNIFWTQAP
jgi:hypothetical protein